MRGETAMRIIPSLASSVFVLIAAQSAFAQTDLERATARDAANNGRSAFDAGKYEKAIDYLSRAEQLVHSPTHLLYMARAQAKLGRLVAAHETYLKITRETLASNAPKAFVAAQAAAEQEQDTINARLPSVTVTLQGATSAPDVTVQMDGTALPAAMIGIPLPADPGEHVFKASGPTIASEPVTVRLAEAAKQTVVLTVRSTGAAAPAVAAGAAKTSSNGATDPAAAALTAPANNSLGTEESASVDSSSGHGPGLLIASLVSFGLGAASAGVGTYYMLKSSSTRNESDQLYENCLLESGGEKCMDKDVAAEVWAKDGDADHQAKIGVVGLVGGGVGIAAGITFLIVDATRGSKSARQSTPHVTPVFGFRSIDLVGTF
jgi:tetratricopeptide (TPR) repeat protein